MSKSDKPTISARAAALHERAFVCDFTLPYADIGDLTKKAETLPRFRAGGVNAVSLSVGGDGAGIGDTVKRIAKERYSFSQQSDRYLLVRTAQDMLAAQQQNKLAILFHFQGTGSLEGEISMVQIYYDMGVRHMLLAYNSKNNVGDGCFEPHDGGLSLFGKRLIAEMNRVGMLIDVSHTGHRTSMEAMELSTNPVIFSHSNPAGVFPHIRNIKDDQIRRCAQTGGVIGIMGVSNMMGPDGVASADLMARHIDYCVQLVGIDHVGISLDFVYDTKSTYVWGLAAAGGKLPEGGNYSADMPVVAPEQFPEITDALLSRGYQDADVCKVLGLNWLRVATEVWK